MPTIGRILCAIDLERASERAFDRALNLAIISEASMYFSTCDAGERCFLLARD